MSPNIQTDPTETMVSSIAVKNVDLFHQAQVANAHTICVPQFTLKFPGGTLHPLPAQNNAAFLKETGVKSQEG